MKNLLMIVALLASFGVKADQLFHCDMSAGRLVEGTPDVIPGTLVNKGRVKIYNEASGFALVGKAKEDTIASGKLNSDGISVRGSGKDKVIFIRTAGIYAIVMGTKILKFNNCELKLEN